MKKTNWLVITVVSVIVIFAMFWMGTVIGGGGYGGFGMMGGYRGYGGYGMMGNWRYSPFGWLGMGLGMLFMWLIPLGLVALAVYGVVALFRNNANPAQPAAQVSCPSCGKSLQAEWRNCPYCGTALK